MNDQPIEELKKTVDAVLFYESVTAGKRLDGQVAFAQLMRELENATTSSGYSSGYRAGWNDALYAIRNHCVDEYKT